MNRISPTMVAKLIVIVFSFAIMAAAMLMLRQQRIEIAHDMATIHQRIDEHERTRWRLREDLARQTEPAQLKSAIDQLPIDWQPITFPALAQR